MRVIARIHKGRYVPRMREVADSNAPLACKSAPFPVALPRPSHVRLLADKVPGCWSTAWILRGPLYVPAVELRSWELSAARPTYKFIASGQICLPVISVRSIRSSIETTLLLDAISKGGEIDDSSRSARQYLIIFFILIQLHTRHLK